MAVSKNIWLRGAKQKLGGVVLYQAMGETRMRELAPSITNPRTPSQMSQRVLIANVVAMYRASSGWMKGAFESKPQNQTDYNAFVSANLTNSRVALTKQEANNNAAVVAPYRVSQGSLNPISWQIANEDFAVSDLYLGGELTLSTISVAEFSQALMSNNNLPAGAQLSFIQYIQETDAQGTPYVICRAYEVLLDTANPRPLSDYMPTDLFTFERDYDYGLAVEFSQWTGGFAMILSKTEASRILVSTQSIILTNNTSVYNRYSSAAAAAAAVESYKQGNDIFLSSVSANEQGYVASPISILSLTYTGGTYTPGMQVQTAGELDAEGFTITLSSEVGVTSGSAQFGLYRSASSVEIWGTNNVSISGTTVTGSFPAVSTGLENLYLAYISLTIGGMRVYVEFAPEAELG